MEGEPKLQAKRIWKRKSSLTLGWAERRRGLEGALPAAIIGPDPGPAVAGGWFFLHIFITDPKEPSKLHSPIIPKSTWCPLFWVAEAERGGEMTVGGALGSPRRVGSVRHHGL